jgi:hypothetical protein
MEKYISTESKNSLLKVGLYQIICGCIGLLVLLWSLFKTEGISGHGAILLLFIVLLDVFSIFSGYQCLKMKENSLNLSLINQTIQILGLSIPSFTFQFSAGPFMTIGAYIMTTFDWKFDFGLTELDISLFKDTDGLLININIIALVALLLVGRLQNKIKTEMEIRKDNRFL